MTYPGWAKVRAREVVNDFIDSAAPRLNAAEMVMLVERVAAALESLRREMSQAPTVTWVNPPGWVQGRGDAGFS